MLMRTRGAWQAVCTVFLLAQAGRAAGLEPLDDGELATVSGQSLFTSNVVSNGAYTFYRIGLDAELQLNANIKRLALGCDGAAGTGVCDIDLARVRFTGLASSSATDSGPPTDFMLRRPYIEFAIKNAGTAATRELVGFRIGALQALGRLTIGENPNTTVESDDTGIATLSGDMLANVTNGRIPIYECSTLLGGPNSDRSSCNFGGGGVYIGDATTLPYQKQLILGRSTSTLLDDVRAKYSAFTVRANINEALRSIHSLVIADSANNPISDFYISNQKENLVWQKISTGAFTSITAEKGWWMSVPEVQISDFTTRGVRLSTLETAFAGLFNWTVDVPNVDLQQKPVDNCYGNLTFC